MAGATAQIDQSPFGQQYDPLAVRKNDVVDLRFDVLPGVLFQRRAVNFIVEVADVADDCLIFHL